jgi:hypothetical protein
VIVFNATHLSSLSLLVRTYSIIQFILQSLAKCAYCTVCCWSLCYIDLITRYCISNPKFLSALETIIGNWEDCDLCLLGQVK